MRMFSRVAIDRGVDELLDELSEAVLMKLKDLRLASMFRRSLDCAVEYGLLICADRPRDRFGD
jgi:hypothetical protein